MGSLSSSMASSMTSLSSSLTGSMGSLSSSMATSMNSLSSSMGSIMATTGSNLFKGDQTISGSIIPAVNSSYDLGSPTNEFRHLYLSSASLYIDGTKVLGSTTQELQITTDTGQSFKILEAGSDTITLQAADGNITLATSGGGDVILDPTSGVIALKGTTTLYAGNKILSSDGNAIQIGNSVTMTGSLIVTGFIETQELRTTYISSSILYRSGSTKFGDELTDTHSFTGSLSVSGSISIPESGLVSGSSQITYSGLSGVPSGIISGSAQLPSGLVSGSSQILNGSGIWSGSAQLPSGVVSGSAQTIANLPSGVVSGSSQVLAGTTIHSGSFFNGITVVSGSVQVDVMSTTNIARLATTGSNSFTGTQTFGYGRLVAVGHNSSAQITMNASYDGGQTNTYTPGFAGDSTAGMFVMKQSNGGYGDVNFYGKNHQTNGASQDISTFNIIMGMNTNGRVAVGKLTANAPLDVNGNTIISGSLTTTGDINVNSSGIMINRNTSGEPYLFFKKDGVNRGSIYGITGGGLRMFDQSDNQVLTMTGSMIGISETTPTKKLTVNFGTSINDGLLVTGTQRQETRFKSTGEHSNVFIDSGHSNIYLPSLALLRSGTSLGEVRLQRASNSDTYSTFTESEMVIGTTTQTPTSLQMNGNRKLVIDTNGNTNVIGTATISGALTVNSNGFSLKGWRQYAVQISAGGSTNTGAIIFRQFQDSVNWNTGGVVVEIINYSYQHSEYDTRKDFARYGYSSNAATVNQINGNITGRIPQPYWGSAVQGSGVYYYRDLMIDIPAYHAYVINLTTVMSLNGNSTVGNGSIYLFS